MSPTFDNEDLKWLKEIAQTWEISKEAQEQIAKIVRNSAGLSLRRMLEDCKVGISLLKSTLVIECKTELQELSLVLRQQQLAEIAESLALKSVSIYTNGEEGVTIFVNDVIQGIPPMAASSLTTDSDLELIQEVLTCQHPATIVRLSDTKILFCNNWQHKQFASLGAADFLGTYASAVWIPQELNRRNHYLMQDGSIREFEYRGRRRIELLSGIDRLHNLAADFRRVQYLGDDCVLGAFRFK
jgi:hypothetical protein